MNPTFRIQLPTEIEVVFNFKYHLDTEMNICRNTCFSPSSSLSKNSFRHSTETF